MVKKLLISILVLGLFLSPVGCSANDPLQETLYFAGSPPMMLVRDGLVYIELRPDVDFVSVSAHGKPTWVTQGVVGGFSLPVYTAEEELFFDICTPNRYDGASDIYVHIHCWVDTANVDKNFNLEVTWEHWTVGIDVVPATSNIVTIETNTGTAAQYQSFEIFLTIDYDIDVGDPIIADDNIDMRLRRIDASVDEAVGEVVVNHIGVVFRRDKLGAQEP